MIVNNIVIIGLKSIEVLDNVRRFPGINVSNLHAAPLDAFPDEFSKSVMRLAEDIKKNGLINALLVKRTSEDSYQLIAGFRRFKAVQYLGERHVAANVVANDVEDDLLLQLSENIQREDLNPFDIAKALERIKKIEHLSKQSDLASYVNKSASWVSQHLSLLNADKEVTKAVADGEMGLSAASQLASLPKSVQGVATEKARVEAAGAKKKKITAKGARRQVVEYEQEKEEQQSGISSVYEREEEQKMELIDGFLAEVYGDSPVPKNYRPFLIMFWDFLFAKNRLFIER